MPGAVEAAGQWRARRTFDARPAGPGRPSTAPGSERAGRRRPVVSFASNDYLGLASHPAVVAAAHQALDRWGAGSGASRLVTGSRPVHAELEEALAAWKGCERAVVFPTGFAANLSVLSVFGAEGAHIFSDELNHASIIDGCRLARAGVTVYPPRDLDRLDAAARRQCRRARHRRLRHRVLHGRRRGRPRPVWPGLSRRHGALLVLDEAHAVLGPELDDGLGGNLDRRRRAAGGHPVQDPRLARWLRGRPRPVRRAAGQPGPAVHLHHRPHPGRRRRRPGGGGRRAVRRRGVALRARLAGHVARVAAAVGRRGQRAPDHPGGDGRRGRRRGGLGSCCWPGGCGSRPSGRRPFPPGRPACGSPCRRPTPTSRWTG